LRTVFFGTPAFAVPVLRSLVEGGGGVAAVYTQPDRPAGRGQTKAEPPVKTAALSLGLEVRQPPDLRRAAEELRAFVADCFVVAAYGLLMPRALLGVPPRGCVNVHPSLLPRYRGPSPVAAAILAGDDFAGVSIMLLDAGMDTGPILSQAAVSVALHDTTGALTAKLAVIGAALLGETLPAWLRGDIDPRPQQEKNATVSRLLSREDAALDWARDAAVLWRQVRAYQPWPGSHTLWRGAELKILEAWPLPAVGKASPGEVIRLPGADFAFGIGTGNGVLGVRRVQLAGKRPVPTAEFLKGQRDFIGAVLPGPGKGP